MDTHVKEYYRQFSDETPTGGFHRVIALHESPEISWKSIHKECPKLIKGWYELSRLPSADRVSFTHEFWVSTLPYNPQLQKSLDNFFGSLDDIGVFITQQKFDDPMIAHLVYSMKDDSGFFHGELPVSNQEWEDLQRQFPGVLFPADYEAFLRIHNGFSKSTDTGLINTYRIPEIHARLQENFAKEEPLISKCGQTVDPAKLIPFYESFGLPCYQLFWGEWYPDQEMGNVYYSGLTNSISDCESSDPASETMAFPTFTDWLMFYLERME